jgi:hypothetical protein
MFCALCGVIRVKIHDCANLSNFKSLTMRLLHSSIDEAGDCASAAFYLFLISKAQYGAGLEDPQSGSNLERE